MSKFLSERYNQMQPYTPGEQPQDKKYIKLNTNESPFPPSPNVIEALNKEEVLKLNLYSDPTAKMLVESIAKYYKRAENEIFVGNGSDEVLAFAFNAFCGHDKGMACPEIGYGFYPVFCELLGIEFAPIEMNDDFSIDISKFKHIPHNITIANPNAQTGIYLSLCDIKTLLLENEDRLVIVDEAYCDFGGESAVKLLDTHKNLIVVGTLSKSRQLAGARIGFAIASAEIVSDLNKMKFSFNPYNINRLSIIAGSKAIDDENYFIKCKNQVIENREWTKTELLGLGFSVTESLANFVLVSKAGIGGNQLYLKLKERGILVRFLSDAKLANYVRITIGSKEQMQAIVRELKSIIEEIKSEKK